MTTTLTVVVAHPREQGRSRSPRRASSSSSTGTATAAAAAADVLLRRLVLLAATLVCTGVTAWLQQPVNVLVPYYVRSSSSTSSTTRSTNTILLKNRENNKKHINPKRTTGSTTRRRRELVLAYKDDGGNHDDDGDVPASTIVRNVFTTRRRTRIAGVAVSGGDRTPKEAQQADFVLDEEEDADDSEMPSTNADNRETEKSGDGDDAGVGFWTMIQCGPDDYVPVRVTDDAEDAASATSPQALTMLQLLAGVDMAGAILPPDILSRIAVLSCEEKLPSTTTKLSPAEMELVKDVATKLQDFAIRYRMKEIPESYSEQHEYPWIRSKILLPTVTLDEVQMQYMEREQKFQYTLKCSAKDIGRVTVGPVTESVMEQVSYRYVPQSQISTAFTCIALALRYKAPIVLVPSSTSQRETIASTDVAAAAAIAAPGAVIKEDDATESKNKNKGRSRRIVYTLDEVRAKFPMYRSSTDLQKTTRRVQQNVERGFQVNQLQAALRIAQQRNDAAAETKIRAKLDELDRMDDLPTLEHYDHNHNRGDGGDDDDGEHGDPFKNGLDSMQ